MNKKLLRKDRDEGWGEQNGWIEKVQVYEVDSTT